MGSHLKMLILNKMLPNIVRKETITKYIRNMQVIHKSEDNKFFVDMNCSTLAENERLKLADTGQRETDIKITNSDSKEIVRFQIERKLFIKFVLEGILTNVQHNTKKSKRIVIDFSSPNIAKPFHVGHLRSTIIGNFIGNINNYYNNNVIRINYLGDWGTQFGILQYGLKMNNINLSELKTDPMRVLFTAYVAANKLSTSDDRVQVEAREYFSDIEQGKTDMENWKIIREITVQELKQTYKRLGITFDAYHWESDYNGKAIKELMKCLEEKQIIQSDNQGKMIAKINNRNITVLKSDNSTLYISRDIAALVDRYKKYKFDEMLYVVDNSQTDHFNALIEIVKSFDRACAEGCKHIKFGRIRGMSTRSGNVVFLNDILDEAKHKMFEQQLRSKNTRSAAMDDSTCDVLGATAVIINDLKQRRQKDYTFDWQKTLQSEGDSGIKLQYLHCRLWSLENNCGIGLPEACEPEFLNESIVDHLIVELAKFEDVLIRSSKENEACILVGYLFRLARHVNRVFNEIKVRDVSLDLARQRLLVFHASRTIVKTGLEILGVKPLYQM